MSSASKNAIEAEIGAALDARDFNLALTLTIRGYGGELLGFIESRVGSLADAREAFGWFSEDLWRSLPKFARHCSMRTWAYALSRNAAARYCQRELDPRKRAIPLSRVSRLSLLLPPETTRDTLRQREERLVQLRSRLSEEEQLLLTLRVDRELDWKDVARILSFHGGEAAQEELEREALRLRQRFHVLKGKLRTLVTQ